VNELATQFDTLPPHDLDAERSAIASFIVDQTGEIRRHIAQLVTPDSFFLPDNGIIFGVLLKMHEQAKPIDIVTLRDALKATGQYDEVGGVQYLGEVLQTVPSAANGETYAKIVRDHAARRWLIRKADTLRRASCDTSNEPVKIAAALRDSLDPFIARVGPKKELSGGANELRERLDDIAAGKIVNMPFGAFPKLTTVGQALQPGSLSIFVGTPGDGKTFAIMSWIAAWTAAGIPVSVLMCEQTRAWHLTRFMAMLWQDGNMMDYEWQKANPAIMREREEASRDAVEAVGRTIHVATLNAMTLNDAGDWIEAEAEKSRILIVDPITALDAGDQSWKEDKRMAARTKKAMERHGSSAIFVTHPKKGTRPNGIITLDDIAGGQAYQGFSDFVMSIYRHMPRKTVEIRKMGYPEQVNVNRTLHINKARNGTGAGLTIAADFSKNLQWSEVGIVTKEIKKNNYSEAV